METLFVFVFFITLVAFGHAILQLFGVIIWFLEPETVDTIPYTVASTLAVFPLALQPDTIDLLAGTLLPICLSKILIFDLDITTVVLVLTKILLENEYESL